jgi:Divergent InlB B-repeat domain/Viral BACON domain
LGLFAVGRETFRVFWERWRYMGLFFCVTASQRRTGNSKNQSDMGENVPVFKGANSRILRAMIALGVAVIAMLLAIPEGCAQPQNPIMPRLSVAKWQFFQNNPAAWNQFLSQLPRRPAERPQATPQPSSTPNWQTVTAAAPGGLSNPLLLTDGTVIAHTGCTSTWYQLTPDITGSYVNGTWMQIASLPSGYDPLYFASAVLPDGRVIIQGGEYNNSTSPCYNTSSATPVLTSLGAIYDPVANTWTSVPSPSGSGWVNTAPLGSANGGIGDAASIVLPNGTFMLSACCANPPVDALFNATTLGWNSTGAPSSYQDEQGYTLLQTGRVLTIDVWDPPNVQQYDPTTGIWTYIASTPVPLVDPTACGFYEIGPAVTRPDGTVVAFGGNTGCTASPADPTAIYTPSNNTWTQGPNVPATCGTNGTTSCTLADAPGALLPNGNILFAASAGAYTPPTHFFEFTSANIIDQVADDVYFASSSASNYYNFLVLPNGQILATDNSGYAEIYTPTGSANAAWAPTITSVAGCVTPGSSYVLSGTQLNGLSQGAAFGDDAEGATNYPLVRIVNNGTGHVFYARTFGHSTMSIATGMAGSTNFRVAAGTELGASMLYVVANGIPSAGAAVTVSSPCPALQVTPATNIVASGTQGGPFSPGSFSYTLSATIGSVNYSITNVPSWLIASPTSGTVSTSATTITFTINSNANSLTPNTYVNSINFTNTTNNQGNTTRTATLTVNPPPPVLQVTPTTSIVASGTQGGPFSPSSFSYTLSATSGRVNFSISGVPNWLTPSSTSGTASSGTTVTFTVNANANSLAVGTYGPTTITFTNTDTGQGTTTVSATLIVNPQPPSPVLQVTPATNIVASGNQGGPFSPSSFSYVLSATSGSVNYSITNVPNWLTPSSTSGNASSGTTVTFTVKANSFAPGTYGPITITFTNTDSGQGTQTRTATLIVNPAGLQVTPITNIAVSGTHGGPFSPSSFTYTLRATSGSVKYSITNVPTWLTASSTSGTATTSAKTVTFRINSRANTLSANTYFGSINFNNATNNQGSTTRAATLTVNPNQYTITVRASPSTYGTVSGGGTFSEGTSHTVTATPNSGHTFFHWTNSGRVVSTSANYTFTLSANVTLVAVFR